MVQTPSTMTPLGAPAPDFSLPDSEGNIVSLSDCEEAPALLVVFMCNHCPFVKHVRQGLVQLGRDLQREGVAVVGINANDAEKYPQDSPERMRDEVAEVGYTFPYLFDETQEVAKAYGAACTPDFYGFDKDLRLQYRGRIYEMTGRQPKPGAPHELLAAMRQVARSGQGPRQQSPSMGCSIKWRAA